MSTTSLIDWLRQAYVEPRAETIEARQAALTAYVESLKLPQIPALIACFVLGESCPEELVAEVQSTDATFTESLVLEGRLLAGAALRILLGDTTKVAVAAAYGLVGAAYSRRELLPYPQHLDVGHAWLVERGRQVRSIGQPSTQLVLNTIDFSQPTLQRLKDQLQPNAPQSYLNLIDPLFSATADLHSVVAALVTEAKALRQRSIVHGEETDILWWILGETCNETELPFRTLPVGAAALLAALDLAQLTTLLPAHSSSHALLHRVLAAHGNPAEASTSLAEAINGVPREVRERMAAAMKGSSHPRLMPLTVALRSSLLTKGDLDWIPVFESACEISAGTRLAPVTIATQFLVERLFLKAVGG